MHLFGLLQGVNRLQVLSSCTRTTLLCLASLVAAALVAIFADAVLDLPIAVRVTLNVVGGLAIAAGSVLVIRELLRLKFDARAAARQVECRLGVPNSRLINAVEFASTEPRADSVTLRERTVRMAEEQARDLSSFEVVSWRPVGRALTWAAAAVVMGAVCWLAAPRLFGMVVPRFVDPYGDHPPFTLVTFDISVTPEPVYHGRPATIAAVLGGPETIERADVVFQTDATGAGASEPVSRRVPMFRQDEQTFVLEIERVEETCRFCIDTPSGRSPLQTLSVVEVPFFEEVSVQYRYPEYTGWGAHEQPLGGRGLRALAGTEVVVTASSNLPLESGRVDLLTGGEGAAAQESEVALAPLAAHPQTVRGSFRLTGDGQFRLSLKAESGGESLEPLSGVLTAVPDRPPQVAIVEPQPHVIVVEDWSVPVVVEAVDDVKIASLRLNRSVNGWGPSTVGFSFETHRSGAVRGQAEFDLAELGARAGDIITYYATAADNHPDPIQFADSPTYVIQVISEEDYVQFARQQYQLDELTEEFAAIQERLESLQRQREAALEKLAAIEEQLVANPDDPALQEQLEAAAEEVAQLSAQAESLAENLEERIEQLPLYDLEEPYTDALKELADDLREQSKAAEAVSQALRQMQQGGATPENQQALREATEQLQQQQEGLGDEANAEREAMQQDLELLQMADKLLAQTERLKGIIQQQRELATRLGEFQNQSNLSPEQQQRADQLARQQELLEQELQEVAKELEAGAGEAAERLPRMSESALQIAQAIREMEIPLDQQQAAAQARQGAGREAHERADSAADKLEQLAGQCPNCQSAAGEMCSGVDRPLSLSMDSLQQSLEQLAQGRGLPGMPRPGQGSGQGQRSGSGGSGTSGMSGRPQGGAGDLSRWRPGQTFSGSQARTPILGPRMLMEQQQARPGGQLGANERGRFVPGLSGNPLGESELLSPEARESRASSAGSLRGVPVPYRRDAEAYFRRLAEDEAAR